MKHYFQTTSNSTLQILISSTSQFAFHFNKLISKKCRNYQRRPKRFYLGLSQKTNFSKFNGS